MNYKMEYCSFDLDGKEVRFLNAWRDTRSGFAHDSSFRVGGHILGEATCHYLNRTWEMYAFQTSMLCAVDNAEKETADIIRANFKRERGLAQVRGKNKDELQALIDSDPDIVFYRKVKDELRTNCHYSH